MRTVGKTFCFFGRPSNFKHTTYNVASVKRYIYNIYIYIYIYIYKVPLISRKFLVKSPETPPKISPRTPRNPPEPPGMPPEPPGPPGTPRNPICILRHNTIVKAFKKYI